MSGPSQPSNLKERLHEVIFEADTTPGRIFDVALLVAVGEGHDSDASPCKYCGGRL